MDASLSNVCTALILTLLAGLSTGIGSLLAFYRKQTSRRFLSVALGFSAGVMIYVSFVEIFPQAIASLNLILGNSKGMLIATIAFFTGIAIIAIIDKLVPSFENPHEMHDISDMQIIRTGFSENIKSVSNQNAEKSELMRLGLFSAMAIGIHNFPEGIATFTAALKDPTLGLTIAIAIAIHNIPEGIAISVPVYYATGDKKRAFKLSFLAGFSEPVGAIVGYFLLLGIKTDLVFGLVFAAVAGIMVYISLDELLPTAEKYGEHHLAIYGMIAGMAVMAFSLILLA